MGHNLYSNEKHDHDNHHGEQLIEDVTEFYSAIDRCNLSRQLSSERPYIYYTMEVYDQSNGIRGGGGLGVLAADTRRVAQELDIPLVLITPFYRQELTQVISNLSQTEELKNVSPLDHGYEFVDDVWIHIKDQPDVILNIYQKILGSTRFLTMSEPNFGELYAGDGSGDHRLYQMISLGFGGYWAMKRLGIKPAIIQLNETATVFAAVARLNELCSNGMNLYEALVYVRKHTLYTNHTLVQAAESEFSYDQFDRFVFPNITSPALRRWIGGLFVDGRLKLSTLTIELAEAKNGVSRLHAKVADYRDINGEKVKFRAVTNGIDINTWVHPSIVTYFRDKEIIDKFNLPAENYIENIAKIPASDIRELKINGRRHLNQILAHRQDQYGNPIQIPEDAIVFDFKRRFVEYKRPWLPFENLDTLKQILLENNAHYVAAGRVHLGDTRMYQRLQQVLAAIDADPVLKERVHYIQNYNEELGLALAVGADVAINVPIVGLEACGTSFMKDIANFKILISTPDGGVADLQPAPVLEVLGHDYHAEVESVYAHMRHACKIIRDDHLLESEVHRQLTAYLPIISGARMMKDYLKFLFPGR
ncbi:alpha-glucan family phosphorylase [Candidatus Saccharibacteria bacterium]|nr:alpha-glucan family phosphorylase [Candidatus Saccharibacteria bacterium]